MNLSKKAKIILVSFISIILIITYFLFFKSNNYDNIEDFAEEPLNQTLNSEIVQSENVPPAEIVVHITGAINSPGIIRLQEGSRIADAIEKADGITTSADLNKINLAYILEDAQKIYIPNKTDKSDVEYILGENNQSVEGQKKQSSDAKFSSKNGNSPSSSNNSNKTSKTSVNLNSATQEELQNLPGIGPSTAIKISNYRNENGKFNSIEDIKNVKGIGDSKYEKIKDYIYVK